MGCKEMEIRIIELLTFDVKIVIILYKTFHLVSAIKKCNRNMPSISCTELFSILSYFNSTFSLNPFPLPPSSGNDKKIVALFTI